MQRWVNERIRTRGLRIENFDSDFDDGSAFSALIASLAPDFDHNANMAFSPEMRMEFAFEYAHNMLGVPVLVSGADMAGCVDEKAALTYLAMLYRISKDPDFLQKRREMKKEVVTVSFGGEWESARNGVLSSFLLLPDEHSPPLNKDLLRVIARTSEGVEIPVEIQMASDGSVICKYTPTIIGDIKIEVFYSDKLLIDNMVNISAPIIDLTFKGTGLQFARVGERAAFSLSAYESETKKKVSSSEIRCVAVTPNGDELPIECVMTSTDEVSFEYLATVVGSHHFKIYCNNELIAKRVVRVKPPPLHFDIQGPGLHELVAEDETEFSVCVFDRENDCVLRATEDVVVVITDPSASPLTGIQKYQSEDLSTLFIFTPKMEGPHQITIEYQDLLLLDITVNAKPTRDRHFILQGAGLHGCCVGEQASFEIHTYDKAGGTRRAPDGKAAVVITDSENRYLTPYIDERHDHLCVSYTPLSPGVHSIAVFYNSKFVISANAIVYFSPQSLHFDLKGPGLRSCILNEETHFTLKATEKESGNSVDVSENIEVTLLPLSGGEVNSEPISVKCQNEGKDVVCKFTATALGKYRLKVTYTQKPLLTKDIECTPKSKGMHFTIKGSGLKNGKVNQKCTIQVKILDRPGGSVVIPVGNQLECVVRNSVGESVEVNVCNCEDGSKELWYVPLSGGAYSVLLKYGEKKLIDTTVQFV
jgi:hypothetical protein